MVTPASPAESSQFPPDHPDAASPHGGRLQEEHAALTRRAFLRAAGMVGMAAATSCGPVARPALTNALVSCSSAQTHRIDTHQHYLPPGYAGWLTEHGVRPGGLDLPKWSSEAARKMMDERGIQTGILSLSTPGVNLGDTAVARTQAREVNEYAAELVQSNPGRFGFFATLTLPDVEGSIGSDWPFAPSVAIDLFDHELERYPLSPEQCCAVNRGTGEALFPRFA